MVIDTSALVAILSNEPERSLFNELIEADSRRFISAGTLLESSMVLESRGGDVSGRELDLFLQKAGFQILAFDEDQVEIARRAFRRYGKGRHPAGLNFGDCFAYAAAMATGEPLLFKGDDFNGTDVEPVV